MLLTDNGIKSYKPGDKIIKLRDGGSLFVHIKPNGTKRFVMAYRFRGKQKSLALGVYPAVSLKEARRRRDEAKELLEQGVDPGARKQAEKSGYGGDGDLTFKEAADIWFRAYKVGKAEVTTRRSWSLLEKYVFPWIGGRSMKEITRLELVSRLDPITEKGFLETAEKVARIISDIFDQAVNRGHLSATVANKLVSVVPPHKDVHRAAILDRDEFGKMLAAIDEYTDGRPSATFCLRIMPYVFVRHSELRCARWAELDLDAGKWLIPAERMKMKQPHFVPLASQVVKLFREVRRFTGGNEYVFPSLESKSKPISDAAMRVVLRRLGYAKEEVTVHGFRSSASTFLHEMGFPSQVIERQLAHKDKNEIRAAYNFAEFIEERTKMMQTWADYVDSLKDRHRQ